MSHIVINRIPVESAQDVVDFVNSDFAKTEPLCAYLGTLKSPFNDLLVLRTVQSGLSFEALDTSKSNKRVGVFLILPVKKGVKSAMDQELENFPMDEKMGKISDLLDYAKSMVEPIIQQNEYMDGMIMSVLTGYGGQGIATRLLNAVEGLTKEMKLKVIYVGCTSKYSALVMAKSGYEEVYSFGYDQYIKDGVQVFKPEPPHDTMSAYIKLLD